MKWERINDLLRGVLQEGGRSGNACRAIGFPFDKGSKSSLHSHCRKLADAQETKKIAKMKTAEEVVAVEK